MSRIAASIVFMLLYRTDDALRYSFALGIALLALCTDFLDGFLARRWRVASQMGYFIDGLSDKVFYVGIILVAVREQFATVTLAWLVVNREIALYALRSIDRNWIKNIEELRFFSLAYALLLRLYFGGFILVGGFSIIASHVPIEVVEFVNGVAFAAICVGYVPVVSLVHRLIRENWA